MSETMPPAAASEAAPPATGETPPEWEAFGPTRGELAAALGVRPELLFAYMGSALGGLAGDGTRMTGPDGRGRSPAVPMVLAVDHPGRAKALRDLAAEPIALCGEVERSVSRSLDLQRFRSLSLSPAISSGHTSHLNQIEALGGAYGISPNLDPLIRFLGQQQPSVALSSPDPASFNSLLDSVMDGCPLVIDTSGSLIRNVIEAGPRQKEWEAMLDRIRAGIQGGSDRICARRGSPSLSEASWLRPSVLIHMPAEMTRAALLHPAAGKLFESVILVPTSLAGGGPRWEQDSWERGPAARYGKAVGMLAGRRMRFAPCDRALKERLPWMEREEQELERQLDALPREIRRYCGGLYDLPMRLLWTALTLKVRGEDDATLAKSAALTARWCVKQHVALVRRALAEEETRQLREAAAAMYWKLRGLPDPCKLSDLLRRYHCQSKDRHLPVLELLEKEGVLAWDPGSRVIRLGNGAPPGWLEGGLELPG